MSFKSVQDTIYKDVRMSILLHENLLFFYFAALGETGE